MKVCLLVWLTTTLNQTGVVINANYKLKCLLIVVIRGVVCVSKDHVTSLEELLVRTQTQNIDLNTRRLTENSHINEKPICGLVVQQTFEKSQVQ